VPLNMNRLFVRIRDMGTSYALNWNPIYVDGFGFTLSTTTVPNKTMYFGFAYNPIS
jgi:hypothetical protein